MKKTIVWWKIIAGAVAVPLAGYMLYAALTIMPAADREWKEKSARTTGTVVQLRETLRNRARCCYADISFKDDAGRGHTFSPYGCYSCGAFYAGQTVRVRYSRENPETAFIDSESHDRATYIAIYALCGILLVAGIFFIISGARGKEA
ncbi:MAG TPA: DUF3592 domain-containing protein [Spirochaetota bacterium]|nr:DUF3592 domain-containing protein [Spirochaetota bacterium]HPC40029.1 DUF3592 domain-containing protein [Spirochaetota bacterium]HPL15198.1 DUF3592 domain-containing protein [Spirochaetota bacterium]HQF09908.1 DUF3592 domain-containing protein [Spirochaetota bacterium]HQH98559.1 DUF3592 domain-containing protein [Spirochaetota bacterium]